MGEGLDVEADHLLGLGPVGSTKFAVIAHAGVVDEAVGIELIFGERVDEVDARLGIGEITDEDLDLEVGVGRDQFLRDFLKNFLASGDENEGLDVRSELAGKFQPQSGAGPGDEDAAEVGAGLRVHK